MLKKIAGECFAAKLHRRGEEDPHVMVTLMISDDQAWHPKVRFSSHWLDDLIEVLQQTKAAIAGLPDSKGGGKEFLE